MAKKESTDDFVPDLSSEKEKDGYDSSSGPRWLSCRIDPDILKSAEQEEVDIFRSGNGSKSNLVRAKTNNKITSDERLKIKNSDAKTGNKTSDATTGNKTNYAKTKTKTSVANPTACTSGWGACLTGGEAKHQK
jgi:hypothetical protein